MCDFDALVRSSHIGFGARGTLPLIILGPSCQVAGMGIPFHCP